MQISYHGHITGTERRILLCLFECKITCGDPKLTVKRCKILANHWFESASLVEFLGLVLSVWRQPFQYSPNLLKRIQIKASNFLNRSGKIMRRVLKKIAADDHELGDISTMADSSVVQVSLHESESL